jgi:hypothetical protein
LSRNLALQTHFSIKKPLFHKTLMQLSTYCMYLPQMYVEFDNCISLLHFQVTLLNTRDRRYYIFYCRACSIHIHISPAVHDLQGVVTYSIHNILFPSTYLFLDLIYGVCAVLRYNTSLSCS